MFAFGKENCTVYAASSPWHYSFQKQLLPLWSPWRREKKKKLKMTWSIWHNRQWSFPLSLELVVFPHTNFCCDWSIRNKNFWKATSYNKGYWLISTFGHQPYIKHERTPCKLPQAGLAACVSHHMRMRPNHLPRTTETKHTRVKCRDTDNMVSSNWRTHPPISSPRPLLDGQLMAVPMGHRPHLDRETAGPSHGAFLPLSHWKVLHYLCVNVRHRTALITCHKGFE